MTFNSPTNEISDYWRLCDELSVRQAALLTVGCDPASEIGAHCDGWKLHDQPEGYEAAKNAIGRALRRGLLRGEHWEESDYDMNGNEIGFLGNTTDINRSYVERDSLARWLLDRGINKGFFAPAQSSLSLPGYLDKTNPRYAPKLAAAVSAWTAVTDPGQLHPKKALDKWLREHAAEFGLSDDEGKPNEQGIEETSKVANWRPGGGPGKTPG